MSYQEISNAAGKLQSFIELIGRAQAVLQAAAKAESEVNSLNEQVEKSKVAAAQALQDRTTALAQLSVAQEAIDAAKAEAEQIKSSAHIAAKQVVEDAKAAAVSLQFESQVKLKELSDRIESLRIESNDIEQANAVAKSLLALTEKKIADAKAAALASLS